MTRRKLLMFGLPAGLAVALLAYGLVKREEALARKAKIAEALRRIRSDLS